MIVIEGKRWLWHDRMVFFPNLNEIQSLINGLAINAVVRIRQTSVLIHDHPNIIKRGVFRTSCIDLTRDLDALYREMDPKSCRYEIRKAQRLEHRLRITCNELQTILDFFQLYNSFVRLKGHTHPISWRRLQEYLPVSDVWCIYLDDRVMCGHLLVRDTIVKRVRLIFSARRLQGAEDTTVTGALNRYLHWEELQRYKDKGIEIYDFGGIGDGSSSVAKFKLSFGGFRVQDNSYVFAGAMGTIGYKAYSWLTQLRRRFRL